MIPAATPTAAPVVFDPREVGLRYEVEHWNDHWVIRTNADDAVDWKLVTARTAHRQGNWKDWIAHQPAADLRDHGLQGWFVRLEKVDALNRIVVTAANGEEHTIASTRRPTRSPWRAATSTTPHPALRLQLDDHAPAVVRLRHGQP
jgi:oligopeptidase B